MSKVKEVIEKLEKKFGKGCVARGDEAEGIQRFKRIETGILGVDAACGGGIPYGTMTLMWGPESGGKSFLALKTIAAAKNYCRIHVLKMVDGKCPKCKKHKPMTALWLDLEGCYIKEWAEKLGVDTSLVHVSRPQTAEAAGDISMALLQTGEFDICVVDSLASMVPQDEAEDSFGNIKVGMQARLVNRMFRAWSSLTNSSGVLKDKKITYILLNQIRYKIGVGKYQDPTTRPGVKAQDFFAALSLKIWRGKFEEDSDGNPISMISCMKVHKNKTGVPGREAKFRIWLVDEDGRKVGDTEEDVVLLEYGLAYDAIERKSNKYMVNGHTVSTQKELQTLLKENAEVREFVRNNLLGKMLGPVYWSIKERDKHQKRRSR